MSAAVGTMGALLNQSVTGEGAYLDVSEQDSIVQNLHAMLRYYYNKQVVSRTDVLDRAPAHILPC